MNVIMWLIYHRISVKMHRLRHFKRDQFLNQLKTLEKWHQYDEMPSEDEVSYVKGLRESALALNEQMIELQGQMGSIEDQDAIIWKLEELKRNFEIQTSENMYLIPHSFDAIIDILDEKHDDIENVLAISQSEVGCFFYKTIAYFYDLWS